MQQGAMLCCNLDTYEESFFSAGSQDINERNAISFLRKCFCPTKIRLCWIFNPTWSTTRDILMLCSPGWKIPSPHLQNSSGIISLSSWTWQSIRELEALTARLELMYRNAGEQAGIYLSEIQKIVPDSGERVDYQWFRGKPLPPLCSSCTKPIPARSVGRIQ